jgi:hypothetical protein
MIFASMLLDQPPQETVSRAVIMLLVLTMLLGAFVLGIALLTVLRRRRNHAMRSKARKVNLPDPWKASAERLQVDPPRRR